MLKCK
jgi:large subunit ribosomal protein L35